MNEPFARGPHPTSERVTVSVTFTYPDGRVAVAETVFEEVPMRPEYRREMRRLVDRMEIAVYDVQPDWKK